MSMLTIEMFRLMNLMDVRGFSVRGSKRADRTVRLSKPLFYSKEGYTNNLDIEHL